MESKKEKPKVTGPLGRILSALCEKAFEGSVPEDILADLELIKEVKGGKFIPPSLQDVTQYMIELEIHNPTATAAMWVDFYSMKNWKVGKETMKDWKAGVRYALRTWDSVKKKTTIV